MSCKKPRPHRSKGKGRLTGPLSRSGFRCPHALFSPLHSSAGAIVLAGPDAHSLIAGAEPKTTPPAHESQSEQDLTTTLDDQSELSLTVYNSDIALVRDVRNLQLARGIGNLRFMDIAATVNPATVHFRSLTEPSQVSVLEQNYEYDLLDPDKLLRKYVGREVTLMRNRQDGGSTRQEEVKALLLSYNTSPVWKIGNEIVTGHGRRSHPLPRAARHALLTSDADLDGAERRRGAAPR